MAIKQAAILCMAVSASLNLALPAMTVDSGAKGLFFQQLNSPSENLNTGIQYWIELNRNGKSLSVNNKIPFRSGDRIRFHVKANIDAWAYIVLKEGSQGEQAVLFPDPLHNDETRVSRGRDYSLPSDGFLTFDQNPGTEKVTLLLSREPIDATSLLNDINRDHTVIAAVQSGSKDLVPEKIALSYESTPIQDLVEDDAPSQPKKGKTAGANGSTSKKHLTKASGQGKTNVPARKTSTGTSTSLKPGSEAGQAQATSAMAAVTVVNKNPADVLALDITLEHLR